MFSRRPRVPFLDAFHANDFREVPDMSTKLICIAMALLVASALNGCIALGIGAAGAAGGVEYAEGRASGTVEAPIERVYSASLAALESQELPILHKELGTANADINSEYINGDKIRIDIVAQSSTVSVLHVRVGMTGNRSLESELMESIKKRV
jgi:hypothetical protein